MGEYQESATAVDTGCDESLAGDFPVDIGTLLSALNKDMQANALFPNGLGGPSRGATPVAGSGTIATAAAAALAEAAAAANQGSPTAQAAAAANAAALAAGKGAPGSSSANAAALAAARASAANAAALNPNGASGSRALTPTGNLGGRAGVGGLGGTGVGGTGVGGLGLGGTGLGGSGVAGGVGGAKGAGGGLGGTGTGGLGGPGAGGIGSAGGFGAGGLAGASVLGAGGMDGAGNAGAGRPGSLTAGGAANAAPAEALADVYHSSGGTHSSPSLLAQSGVKAYTQLLNTLSQAGHSEKSAEALTNTLLLTSATLKSAYQQAVAKLPDLLQSKDWRFSVSNGALVFAAGNDELSSQELTLLRAAFGESEVEPFANEVASAITTMEAKRSTGADMNSLAWGRFPVDDNNFEQVVDLRSYLTSTAPGGKYSTNIRPEVPLTLGGMYLGDLVTTRSDFFRPDIPARSDALHRAVEAAANAEVGMTLHGRCTCGEVTFTLENTFDYAYYCHCSRCRMRTGSAFAAIGGASIDKLQITTGNKHLLIEGECSDGYGARCSRCYAFLFAAVRGRQYVHVSLGVLAGTPSRLPDHHIYVASKAPWYQITDGLPQYDELPLPLARR